MISAGLDPERFIFTADARQRIISDGTGGEIVEHGGTSEPPFYSLKAMGVHCRQRYYELDLETGVLTVSDTAEHTAPRPEEELPGAGEMGRIILELLDGHGYDTSSIETPLPVRTIP